MYSLSCDWRNAGLFLHCISQYLASIFVMPINNNILYPASSSHLFQAVWQCAYFIIYFIRIPRRRSFCLWWLTEPTTATRFFRAFALIAKSKWLLISTIFKCDMSLFFILFFAFHCYCVMLCCVGLLRYLCVCTDHNHHRLSSSFIRCVQRLRRRITETAEQLSANASLSAGSASSVVVTGSSRLDGRVSGVTVRQDSFYTSRSIVSLSGLSVADPAPVSFPATITSSSNISNSSTSSASRASGSSGNNLSIAKYHCQHQSYISYDIVLLLLSWLGSPLRATNSENNLRSTPVPGSMYEDVLNDTAKQPQFQSPPSTQRGAGIAK